MTQNQQIAVVLTEAQRCLRRVAEMLCKACLLTEKKRFHKKRVDLFGDTEPGERADAETKSRPVYSGFETTTSTLTQRSNRMILPTRQRSATQPQRASISPAPPGFASQAATVITAHGEGSLT